ncbi:MAG: hypothetical protein K8R91_00070, partial [Phycisphaerae bacterium]|nr:hypothetical protein [Phycisphaerae bacterium]
WERVCMACRRSGVRVPSPPFFVRRLFGERRMPRRNPKGEAGLLFVLHFNGDYGYCHVEQNTGGVCHSGCERYPRTLFSFSKAERNAIIFFLRPLFKKVFHARKSLCLKNRR